LETYVYVTHKNCRNVKQEGWLSPTERASLSAISLRHIIWRCSHCMEFRGKFWDSEN